MDFVNRSSELATLDQWADQPGAQLGVVWGRRRVGKTFLLAHWARNRRAILHIARNRPPGEELAELSRVAAPILDLPLRDLRSRPFTDWDDAFETFAASAEKEPLIVIIDEFQELLHANPKIESALRAIWERVGPRKLRLLLCGSAVRTMESLQEERAPLFGRATLRIRVRPFAPYEAALMLKGLSPAERARAWGVCGGSPFYLSLWNSDLSFKENLYTLFGSEQGILLNEGQLVLSTEDFAGGRRERIPEQVLRALATGRTRFSELKQVLGTDPSRALVALHDLDLIERILPAGGKTDPRRVYYQVADNFLAFWLGIVEHHQSAISRGLGRSVVSIMEKQFDDFMGPRWEEAFRMHLVRSLADDERVQPIAEIGRFWKQRVATGEDPCEIDAIVLTGRERRLTLAGEAKWARKEDGARLLRTLQLKAHASGLLTSGDPDPMFALCARESVTGDLPRGTMIVTADDAFA